MRDPNRIPKMIALLQELWELQPDTRLGQLVHNTTWKPLTTKGIDLFQIEDDVFLAALQTEVVKMREFRALHPLKTETENPYLITPELRDSIINYRTPGESDQSFWEIR